MPHDPHDPLALAALFDGGGEPWLPLLAPVIAAQPEAATFLGPARDKSIVPLRELTFQALKPNPPGKWNVVVFGQNPYPRVSSATGIAMFDNAFHAWADSTFGKVTSIRCIVKAACMWKHGVDKATSTADIRALLAKEQVVQPPAWFQAMLTQGVLLLNAALTASTDDAISTARHASFWKPVVHAVVANILRAKHEEGGGVVFAWWGNHAKALRATVEKLASKYPNARVRHVDHCNPAAMGDAFCNPTDGGTHFGDVNAALAALGLPAVDWLPRVGWHESAAGGAEAVRMGDFVQKTMDLHKLYLDRLQGVGDEKTEELAAIAGVMQAPLLDVREATRPLASAMPALDHYLKHALAFAAKARAANTHAHLSDDEVAALFLYTTESPLYRALNAVLRDANRARVAPWLPYLRLFLGAVSKLEARSESLWRGVALDLRAQYPLGRIVTWWGVSSCTTKPAVARGFLGTKGRRMLFEVVPKTAVSIRAFSAFTAEEELVLAPGTQLRVTHVTNALDGLTEVRLEELDAPRLVA